MNWKIWASDDGSRDGTLSVLKEYQDRWGGARLSIRHGPAKGFVSNFFSLVCSEIEADYFAYADQDDIWQADKLTRAIEWLQKIDSDTPALYCARTSLVDADNNPIGFSPLFRRPPSFANALVQNIGGGNTMVFNRSARALLKEACAGARVVTHDWWTYLVVSGCGGLIHYDPVPTVQYRQHGNNLIGSDVSWATRLRRIRMLFQGNFKDWNSGHIEALQRIYPKLTEPNRRVFDEFVKLRNGRLWRRLYAVQRSGVYRQSFLGNIGLTVAAIFKKV